MVWTIISLHVLGSTYMLTRASAKIINHKHAHRTGNPAPAWSLQLWFVVSKRLKWWSCWRASVLHGGNSVDLRLFWCCHPLKQLCCRFFWYLLPGLKWFKQHLKLKVGTISKDFIWNHVELFPFFIRTFQISNYGASAEDAKCPEHLFSVLFSTLIVEATPRTHVLGRPHCWRGRPTLLEMIFPEEKNTWIFCCSSLLTVILAECWCCPQTRYRCSLTIKSQRQGQFQPDLSRYKLRLSPFCGGEFLVVWS